MLFENFKAVGTVRTSLVQTICPWYLLFSSATLSVRTLRYQLHNQNMVGGNGARKKKYLATSFGVINNYIWLWWFFYPPRDLWVVIIRHLSRVASLFWACITKYWWSTIMMSMFHDVFFFLANAHLKNIIFSNIDILNYYSPSMKICLKEKLCSFRGKYHPLNVIRCTLKNRPWWSGANW